VQAKKLDKEDDGGGFDHHHHHHVVITTDDRIGGSKVFALGAFAPTRT
jgi:hypothetical protein